MLPSAAQSVRPRSCQRAEGGNGCEYFQTVTEVGPTPSIGASASPIARARMARVGTATVLTALCGYAVVYLAARDLAPAGFSVFAVFWGAFGRVTGMVGIGAALAIAASSPLWSGRVFAEAHWLSVGLLSAGLAGFCVHATL